MMIFGSQRRSLFQYFNCAIARLWLRVKVHRRARPSLRSGQLRIFYHGGGEYSRCPHYQSAKTTVTSPREETNLSAVLARQRRSHPTIPSS
ncbi:MAG: hypothetical protein AB4352_11290 [Hormoscilla sp.]